MSGPIFSFRRSLPFLGAANLRFEVSSGTNPLVLAGLVPPDVSKPTFLVPGNGEENAMLVRNMKTEQAARTGRLFNVCADMISPAL